jgi:hypothetical protein
MNQTDLSVQNQTNTYQKRLAPPTARKCAAYRQPNAFRGLLKACLFPGFSPVHLAGVPLDKSIFPCSVCSLFALMQCCHVESSCVIAYQALCIEESSRKRDFVELLTIAALQSVCQRGPLLNLYL